MAFESIQNLDDDEFFKILLENPQKISIVEISDFRESDDIPNGFYFYITFMLDATSQEKRISYNFKVNHDGYVVIGEGAKLYPLLSYISGIKHGNIKCTKEDIANGLKGLSFEATSSRQRGKKTWYKIIPISRGE